MKKSLVATFALLLMVANSFAADPTPPKLLKLIPLKAAALKRQNVEGDAPTVSIRLGDIPNTLYVFISGKSGEKYSLCWDEFPQIRVGHCTPATFIMPEGMETMSCMMQIVYPGNPGIGFFNARKESK